MDHFLFGLLRWTWDLNGAHQPDRGAELRETDNSTQDCLWLVEISEQTSLRLCVKPSFCHILAVRLFEGRKSLVMSAAERDFDEQWMRQAVAAAREAQANGEVPIGTCIVSENKLAAVSGNRTRTDCDPTAHAEIVTLREAARKLGNYRLTGVDVYSTIEPCAMCAGALIQARVRRLIYGAPDDRAGAVVSRFRICDTGFLNHRIEIVSGVLEAECRALMQEFFRSRRIE
jgi:tRNA(adenine34) deaminase